MNVSDIRNYFKEELEAGRFTKDRNGGQTIEMLGASFEANEPAIFGEPNEKYIDAEIAWYMTKSTNVKTLEELYGSAPAAWQMTANPHGEINSNYGHLIFAKKYFEQFDQVLHELMKNPDSRRAQLVYTRPSIWHEYNENGKSDFICTNAQTFYIRDGELHMVSQMRSNDIWAGYRNDYAWARYIQKLMVKRLLRAKKDLGLELKVGKLYWQVMNLHCYEKNFYLIDNFGKSGEINIPKTEYTKKYPNSKLI